MKRPWTVYLSIFVLAAFCLGAAPKKETRRNPLNASVGECKGAGQTLDVTADRMTFDSKTHAFVFESNVRVVRCDLTMTCDHLRVVNDATGDRVERILATGHVRLRQGARRVEAERAEYFDAEQKLVLTGNPKAWDPTEQNELTGDEMQIFLDTERLVVKQARVLFRPRSSPGSASRPTSSPALTSPGG